MTNPAKSLTKEIRLNRYLSLCGIGARRHCEELILTGRVRINQRIISELAVWVQENDEVFLDGKLILPEKMVYILLNKPVGVVTTLHDPEGRKNVAELVKVNSMVKPVGRLDMYTTGVLLLTNDGELHYRLTHPRFQIVRLYQVTIEGRVTHDINEKIRKGVMIDDRKIATGRVVEIVHQENNSVVWIEIMEGINREVRKIFESLGYRVLGLDRTRFAGIGYGKLKRGEWRYQNPDEIQRLREICHLNTRREKI